jgi:hypothetical protein
VGLPGTIFKVKIIKKLKKNFLLKLKRSNPFSSGFGPDPTGHKMLVITFGQVGCGKIRVVDPDPGSGFNRVCGSGSVFGIRIRIQEGKNDPQK